MAEAEAQLREASSNGDTATVAKLLEAGTAQTADEVRHRLGILSYYFYTIYDISVLIVIVNI